MKLSIITINYNNLEGLRKTYESVVCQTWKDYEWIVIDGGSIDGSKEFIEEHQDKFVYWCSEPDKGIYNAMNKGIAQANGEYLNFLNSGDYYCESTILSSVFKKQEDADIFYGNTYIQPDEKWELLRRPEKMSLAYLVERSICHQASFIKTPLLQSTPYREDLKIVSDWERFINWFLEGRSFVHLRIPIVNYDIHGISANRMEEQELERRLVLDQIFCGHMDILVQEFKRQREALERYDLYEYQAVARLVERGHFRQKLLRSFLRFVDTLDRLIKSYF